MTMRLAVWVALAALLGFAPARAEDGKIKVTVVAVLASSQHKEVDKRLKDLAPELKKKNSAWTGFEVERSSCEWLKVGEKHSFPLVDDCEVVVIVKRIEAGGCVALLMKPPTLGDVEFSCCCGKFFPILTRYETKGMKRLVIAVMVRSCDKK